MCPQAVMSQVTCPATRCASCTTAPLQHDQEPTRSRFPCVRDMQVARHTLTRYTEAALTRLRA